MTGFPQVGFADMLFATGLNPAATASQLAAKGIVPNTAMPAGMGSVAPVIGGPAMIGAGAPFPQAAGSGLGADLAAKLGALGKGVQAPGNPPAPALRGGISGAATPQRSNASFNPGQGLEALLSQLLSVQQPTRAQVPTIGQIALGR